MNLAFGFDLKNIADGGFRRFYAQENSLLLDWLVFVCTKENLAELKEIFNETDVIKSCNRERMNTKWRFYKLINFTVLAAAVKDVPMGCKEAV